MIPARRFDIYLLPDKVIYERRRPRGWELQPGLTLPLISLLITFTGVAKYHLRYASGKEGLDSYVELLALTSL
ncbi:hypothetical protein CC2G_003872 [Coprinopsis cinerea AmutBmut pab1-1]|nr:hypothetical protein CC2G_003872 [Coprinopsis cinerea AmutBmut pab1-1]